MKVFERQREWRIRRRNPGCRRNRRFIIGAALICAVAILIWDGAYFATGWRQTKCEILSGRTLALQLYRFNILGRQKHTLHIRGRDISFHGFFIVFHPGGAVWDENSRVLFKHKDKEANGLLIFDIPKSSFLDRFWITPDCWAKLVSLGPVIQKNARKYGNPNTTIRFQKVSEF